MDSGNMFMIYYANGNVYNGGSSLQSGLATLTNGDILGIAVDCDNGTMRWCIKMVPTSGTTVTRSQKFQAMNGHLVLNQD